MERIGSSFVQQHRYPKRVEVQRQQCRSRASYLVTVSTADSKVDLFCFVLRADSMSNSVRWKYPAVCIECDIRRGNGAARWAIVRARSERLDSNKSCRLAVAAALKQCLAMLDLVSTTTAAACDEKR